MSHVSFQNSRIQTKAAGIAYSSRLAFPDRKRDAMPAVLLITMPPKLGPRFNPRLFSVAVAEARIL
jgi:hypothetical protein